MLALWQAADKFDVLFGCMLAGLFFSIGFLYVMIKANMARNEARDKTLAKRIARLDAKYNLVNGIVPRICDEIVRMGGMPLIEQHHTGDYTNSNSLFNGNYRAPKPDDIQP